MNIADIKIGERHRKELGEIAALAESIKTEGLLQPIGVTESSELVFGYRRLLACRDHLGWTEIDARIVRVTNIVNGEYAENEMRKNFTPSERVAILETMKDKVRKHGGDRKSLKQNQDEDLHLDHITMEEAVRRSGLGNTTTARHAVAIVKRGIPELVAAVDRSEIAIEPGYAIALQPPETQAEIIKLPKPQRRAAVSKLERPGKSTSKRLNGSASQTAQQREQRLLNRPQLKPVETGRPRGAEALEQAPGRPPGMTKGMAWTEKHGRVQPFTIDEVERQKLYARFIEFNALVRKLAKFGEWPTFEDLAKLDDRRRLNVQEFWRHHQHAPEAIAENLKVTIGHPALQPQSKETKE